MTIGEETLSRWTDLFAHQRATEKSPLYRSCLAGRTHIATSDEHRLGRGCARLYQGLQEQAESFLISASWLGGEADELGLRTTAQEVQHEVKLLGERSASDRTVPSGTGADARLAAETGLLVAKIRRLLDGRARPVTQSQILGYYRQHIRSYQAPERRAFDIVSFHSVVAAQRLRREVEAGKSFRARALHEQLERLSPRAVSPEQRAFAHALFAARLHELGGPVELLGSFHSLFEVTKITPAVHISLKQAETSIAEALAGEQRQRTLTDFIAAWRKKWTARTNCSAGFVIAKCRQYLAEGAPEEPYEALEDPYAFK